MEFSYDRLFWRKKFIKSSGISYDKEGAKRDMIKDTPKKDEAINISKWIEGCNIPLLKKIQSFMKALDLIVL